MIKVTKKNRELLQKLAILRRQEAFLQSCIDDLKAGIIQTPEQIKSQNDCLEDYLNVTMELPPVEEDNAPRFDDVFYLQGKIDLADYLTTYFAGTGELGARLTKVLETFKETLLTEQQRRLKRGCRGDAWNDHKQFLRPLLYDTGNGVLEDLKSEVYNAMF